MTADPCRPRGILRALVYGATHVRAATDEFRAGARSKSRAARRRGDTEDSAARPEADDMAKLIYSAIGSLDGYVEDASGKFEWAAPDEEVHAFVNELERPVGTYLYGRRMYETMVFWETVDPDGDGPAVARDFAAIWQAAEKVVYSRTLDAVSSARTRLEPVLQRNA